MRSLLGLGAVDGLHVQGVAEDEGDAFPGAEVGEPVPTVDALDGDDEALAEGSDGQEKAVRVAGQAAMKQDDPVLADDAQVQGPRVQIDPAVVLVRQLVEVHAPPPVPQCRPAGVLSAMPASLREGACMRIKELTLTKPGQRRSFAADPQCSADLGGIATLTNRGLPR